MKQTTKTFTITANDELMGQIERLLACLHLNTQWGHSCVLGLSQDGDGCDNCIVEGEGFDPQKYRVYADWLTRHKSRVERVELVDPPMCSQEYTEYRDNSWQKKYGHLFEEQPWLED